MMSQTTMKRRLKKSKTHPRMLVFVTMVSRVVICLMSGTGLHKNIHWPLWVRSLKPKFGLRPNLILAIQSQTKRP